MLVTNTMEATASTTDSCQVSEPVTATQETPRTIATYTATTPAMHRKSFKEQEPAIFSIIGFAVAYIAALIINRIIKTRKTHHYHKYTHCVRFLPIRQCYLPQPPCRIFLILCKQVP